MKLERNEKSLIFSSTEIPDVFFTEYLSQAQGNYIKVYLYILSAVRPNRMFLPRKKHLCRGEALSIPC